VVDGNALIDKAPDKTDDLVPAPDGRHRFGIGAASRDRSIRIESGVGGEETSPGRPVLGVHKTKITAFQNLDCLNVVHLNLPGLRSGQLIATIWLFSAWSVPCQTRLSPVSIYRMHCHNSNLRNLNAPPGGTGAFSTAWRAAGSIMGGMRCGQRNVGSFRTYSIYSIIYIDGVPGDRLRLSRAGVSPDDDGLIR